MSEYEDKAEAPFDDAKSEINEARRAVLDLINVGKQSMSDALNGLSQAVTAGDERMTNYWRNELKNRCSNLVDSSFL